MVYMMTKKSTRSTATFANVYALINRDEPGVNPVADEFEAALIERLKVNTQRKIDAILLERLQGLNRSAADRRRYYEAS